MFIKPYLLKGLLIIRANQVWCTDITYIPLRNGFMYMNAIIDVYSRKIMAGASIILWQTVGAKKYLKMLLLPWASRQSSALIRESNIPVPY
jgi:hypothetical protein